MFVDEDLDCIVCPSTWKKTADTVENCAQTAPYTVIHRGIQSKRRSEKEAQTEEFLYVEEDIKVESDDSKELILFLQRVYPLLSDQLSKNSQSRAFESQTLYNHNKGGISLKFILKNGDLPEDIQYNVSSISWNCNGSIVAVAYGRHDHQDWCIHNAYLAIWNLSSRQLNVNKPEVNMDVISCITCVKFHPNVPSLIVGGTFNGDIIVWDLTKENDPQLVKSVLGVNGHEEPVTDVVWLSNSGALRGVSRFQHRLVSIGLDGNISVWLLDQRKATLTYLHGFLIQARDLPRSIRVRGPRDKEVVLNCAAVSRHENDTILVGADNGAVLKCSLEDSNVGRSPVTSSFVSPSNCLYSVDWSAHHRHVTVAAGTSGALHMLNAQSGGCVLSLEPGLGYIYSARLFPSAGQALLVAMATQSGHVLIYDMEQCRSLAILNMDGGVIIKGDQNKDQEDLPVKNSSNPIFSLEFSRKMMLAAGDASGQVSVFQISENFYSGEAGRQLELLSRLVDTAVE